MLGRLRTTADFEQVRARGGRWRGKLCVLNAAPQLPNAISPASLAAPVSSTPASAVQPALVQQTLTRVGYITSKKVGKAVKRNRARRLMREAMRHLSGSLVEGWDIVLIAQTRLVTTRPHMQAVKDELKWLLGQAKLITQTSVPGTLPTNRAVNPSPNTLPPAPSPAKS